MAVQPAGKTTFELVSPERLLLSQPVDMVVVPGSEGLFAALIGHAPFIATLRPGVIDVWDGGSITERIFVGGGFAEVTATGCTVLAEQATPVAEIDRAGAEQAVTDAREDVADAKDEVALAVAQAALKLAEARLAAATEPSTY